MERAKRVLVYIGRRIAQGGNNLNLGSVAQKESGRNNDSSLVGIGSSPVQLLGN